PGRHRHLHPSDRDDRHPRRARALLRRPRHRQDRRSRWRRSHRPRRRAAAPVGDRAVTLARQRRVATAPTAEFAERVLADIRALSVDGPGVSRQSYGPGETEALQYLAELAATEGLVVGWDGAANLTVDLPGTDP